jgi:phosphoribosylanthranilate isomerase
MTRIKICGITDLDDAVHASECGADLLGFNFYRKSKRYVEPALCGEIISELTGPVEKVGVFVNETLEDIVAIAKFTRIDIIQLHGDENRHFAKSAAAATGLPVIRAVRINGAAQVAQWTPDAADTLLLDSYSAGEYGGTGKAVDITAAANFVSKYPKVYLAGGLSELNVVTAIRTIRPYGVDACSLLESSPRKKDKEKVRSFIAAARNAI